MLLTTQGCLWRKLRQRSVESKTPGDDIERQVAQVAQLLEAVQQSLVRCQNSVVRVNVQLVGVVAVSLALARSDVDSLQLDDQLRIKIAVT